MLQRCTDTLDQKVTCFVSGHSVPLSSAYADLQHTGQYYHPAYVPDSFHTGTFKVTLGQHTGTLTAFDEYHAKELAYFALPVLERPDSLDSFAVESCHEYDTNFV